jgi:hypothetical protein
MTRRILLVSMMVAGVTGGLGIRARPARAAEGGYQYSIDIRGAEVCGGQCRSGCCKIVPL